jgi:hypothetical protein
MCTKKSVFFWGVIGVLMAMSLSASAAVRFWRDKDGNVHPGTYVRQAFGKTYFRGTDGKSFNLETADLTESDRKYITSLLPPEISITVKDREIEITDYPPEYTPDKWNDHEFEVQATVVVKKKSRDPYSGTLRGEVFLIGEEVAVDYYRLFARKGFSIRFPDGTSESEYQFKQAYRYYDFDALEPQGITYKGYVVVVDDPQGNIIGFKSNLSWLKKENVSFLRKMTCPEWFNDECKTQPVPRPIDTRSPGSGSL